MGQIIKSVGVVMSVYVSVSKPEVAFMNLSSRNLAHRRPFTKQRSISTKTIGDSLMNKKLS